MAQRRTRPLPWYARHMLSGLSMICLVLVVFILSPSFSFENGIDVRFHFSNVYTLILALLFLLALFGLSWLLDAFAATRIDVEREKEQMAAIEAFRSDPRMEALHRLNPASKGQTER